MVMFHFHLSNHNVVRCLHQFIIFPHFLKIHLKACQFIISHCESCTYIITSPFCPASLLYIIPILVAAAHFLRKTNLHKHVNFDG